MPEVVTFDQAELGPVIIEDDGTGMTDAEVQSYYLRVARSRTHRCSNPRTARFNRRIKGKKGIGKFAGLVVADGMILSTRCGGRETTLTVDKDDLMKAVEEESDLEKIDLDLAVVDCPADQHGTKVTLYPLSPLKLPPCKDSLAEMLYWEYGRETGFNVTINGEPLNMGALSEEVHEIRRDLGDGVVVTLRYQVTDKPNKKKSGLHLRVNGKVSGGKQWFGLEDDPELPEKVRNCLIGEIEVEGVDATVIAADGSLFDESKVRASINKVAQEEVGGELKQRHHKQVNLAKARIAKEIKRRIDRLPEHRRAFAEQQLAKVLDHYYPEFPDRVESLVWLALEAMEQDVYWTVCQALKNADHSDTTVLSRALGQFGFADMAYMLHQVHQRLEFLDHLEALAKDDSTLERQMHEAIEHNPWVLGQEFELMYSEQTLQSIIKDYCDTGLADHVHALAAAFAGEIAQPVGVESIERQIDRTLGMQRAELAWRADVDQQGILQRNRPHDVDADVRGAHAAIVPRTVAAARRPPGNPPGPARPMASPRIGVKQGEERGDARNLRAHGGWAGPGEGWTGGQLLLAGAAEIGSASAHQQVPVPSPVAGACPLSCCSAARRSAGEIHRCSSARSRRATAFRCR